MPVAATLAKFRRAQVVQGKPTRQICRELKRARKVRRSEETAFECKRSVPPLPKLGPWRGGTGPAAGRERRAGRPRAGDAAADLRGPPGARLRRRAWRGPAPCGGVDAAGRHGSVGGPRAVPRGRAPVARRVAPGEARQVDWSHQVAPIDGVTVAVKVTHTRLCHGRMPFVRAHPREARGRRRSTRTTGRSPSARAAARAGSANSETLFAIDGVDGPAPRPPAGRRVRSRTRGAPCARGRSRRGCGSSAWRSAVTGSATRASPAPRSSPTRGSPARRSATRGAMCRRRPAQRKFSKFK